MPSIALFTRDLRLADNPVLHAAGSDAIPLFVDHVASGGGTRSPNQTAYLRESLRSLDDSLRQLGSSLVYREGELTAEVTAIVDEARAHEVHIAGDAPSAAQDRVTAIRQRLNIPVIEHTSIPVIEPNALSPATADHYQRFTPYYAKWRAAERRPVLAVPEELRPHAVPSLPIPSTSPTGTSPERQVGGENLARQRLGDWLPRSPSYGETRDELDDHATSQISAALHFGELSPLEVVEAALENEADEFVRQIAWRDFNHQLLFHRPELEEQGLRPDPRRWFTDAEDLAAWEQGRTGYPVVDAAMRQLQRTGWMPNRARMVTASFLTKHLLQDWRTGASWFAQWLTDADTANNLLGWQWVAGVGVDTNPWRMLNPTLQSRRYDPDGDYIRTWVPELAAVAAEDIHDPPDEVRDRTGYPIPLIEHKDAVARFKAGGS